MDDTQQTEKCKSCFSSRCCSSFEFICARHHIVVDVPEKRANYYDVLAIMIMTIDTPHREVQTMRDAISNSELSVAINVRSS